MSFAVRVFPWVLATFLLGVAVGTYTSVFVVTIIPLAIMILGWMLVAIMMRSRRVLFVAVLTLGLLLGLVRAAWWSQAPVDPILSAHAGVTSTLEGTVVAEPDVRERSTQVLVRLTTSEQGEEVNAIRGRLLLFVDRYPEYHYGDTIRITGVYRVPESFTDQDGSTVDYPAYLKSKAIDWVMYRPEVTVTSTGNGDPIVEAIFSLKHRLLNAIHAMLPEPHSALLSGLLLGGKQSLGQEWIDRFTTAGIIHVVVLSGYNMTIVAEWLLKSTRWLGFSGSIGTAMLGIIGFAIMAGSGATVVRAAILAILALVARATGRVSDMGRALLFAGAVMVAIHPGILLSDPSFQLSFLATFGLIFVGPIMAKWSICARWNPVVREIVTATLSTQLLVLPLLLYQTGLLSIVALPVNLLVLPLIPLAMLWGCFAIVGSMLVPALAPVFALPVYGLLSIVLFVAKWAAILPYATLTVAFNTVLLWGSYAAIAWWVIHARATMASEERPLP